LRRYFSDKYSDKPIDLIISIGPAALDLALKLRPGLWPAAPIVFAAVDEDTARHDFPFGVTGIAVKFTLANMIKVAKAVIPIFKRFAIIGSRFEDQLYYRRFAEEVPKIFSGVRIH
jgi:hypothetical protein